MYNKNLEISDMTQEQKDQVIKSFIEKRVNDMSTTRSFVTSILGANTCESDLDGQFERSKNFTSKGIEEYFYKAFNN